MPELIKGRYGVVLAKGKNDDEARKWLIRSVNICPYNWGAWQELNGLLGAVENVGVPIEIKSSLTVRSTKSRRCSPATS